jgi:hypothetical protein
VGLLLNTHVFCVAGAIEKQLRGFLSRSALAWKCSALSMKNDLLVVFVDPAIEIEHNQFIGTDEFTDLTNSHSLHESGSNRLKGLVAELFSSTPRFRGELHELFSALSTAVDPLYLAKLSVIDLYFLDLVRLCE